MASYRGKFQYVSRDGSAVQQGACQIQFDDQKFTLTPESGASLVFDLGDADSLTAADYEIRLPLYSGSVLKIQSLGKSYEDVARLLLESYRKRTLQCLLLADLEEVDRFTGAFTLETSGTMAAAGAAEFRQFKSNLAVLPAGSQAFQWRLADVRNVRLDSQNYEVVLEADGARLKINRLAKRTELFHNTVRESLNAIKTESAEALHTILPFLNADQLQNAAEILPEGHSARTSKLAAIHARIPGALAVNAVDATLKPYYEDLLSRTAKDSLFAGFKLIRSENAKEQSGPEDSEDEAPEEAADNTVPDADKSAPNALYWFFFPLAAQPGSSQPAKVVAWEASSRSGRATYFFRLPDSAKSADEIEGAIAGINRVLGMLNFRRRPIYLSDDELSGNPIFHRYAIAARKIPELREVRASFLGRAAHTSLEAWQAQVKTILARGM